MAEAGPLATMVAPGRVALLVVDVQVDFCAPDGVLGRAGVDLSRVAPAIDRIAALVASARAAGATVAFLRVVTTPATDSAALVAFHARTGAAGGEAIGRAGTRGADWHRIAPAPADIVVDKRLYSGFHDTALDAGLRARGVDTLVLAGVTTDCCIADTARDGFHRGYHIFVAGDACAAYEPSLHAGALDMLSRNCAMVVGSASLCGAWAGATA